MIFPMPAPKAVTLHKSFVRLGFAFCSGLMHFLSILFISEIVCIFARDFVTVMDIIEFVLLRKLIRLLI